MGSRSPRSPISATSRPVGSADLRHHSGSRVDGEWRITAKQDDVTRFGFSSAEEAAYYTFDNNDAISTAKYMTQSAKEYCNEDL